MGYKMDLQYFTDILRYLLSSIFYGRRLSRSPQFAAFSVVGSPALSVIAYKVYICLLPAKLSKLDL